MENLFLKYMRERNDKRTSSAPDIVAPGPVITISRDYGCPGRRIARLLSETLTKKNLNLGSSVKWKWISKEIIEKSAQELRLSPTITKELSDYRARGFFENLALFFSDEFYPGDVKIKNTIARFIYNAAAEGNVVIVGRAAESITKHFEKSLHIKLQAPLEWRTRQVADSYGMTMSDAKKEVLEMDKRRSQFRNYFEKDLPDIEFFDMFFNVESMTDEEIIEMIIIIAETRGFV